MSKILAVGIATIDIINTVTHYPEEDSEVRATSQRIVRGGNATNTLTVLSQLGHQCFWAGTMANDINASIIEKKLAQYQINYDYVTVINGATNPSSYIIHCEGNEGKNKSSRSIVHYRDLSEYSFAEFQKIPLAEFDWIHFEGRNIEQVFLMQQYCKQHYPNLPISTEIEKNRSDIEKLYQYSDVLMFSRQFALAQNKNNAKEFLNSLNQIQLQDKLLSCTWAEQGACLMKQGEIISSKAFYQNKAIDTLAAGDTYNASLIHGLLSSDNWSPQTLQVILQTACQTAGKKCSQIGLDNLF